MISSKHAIRNQYRRHFGSKAIGSVDAVLDRIDGYDETSVSRPYRHNCEWGCDCGGFKSPYITRRRFRVETFTLDFTEPMPKAIAQKLHKYLFGVLNGGRSLSAADREYLEEAYVKSGNPEYYVDGYDYHEMRWDRTDYGDFIVVEHGDAKVDKAACGALTPQEYTQELRCEDIQKFRREIRKGMGSNYDFVYKFEVRIVYADSLDRRKTEKARKMKDRIRKREFDLKTDSHPPVSGFEFDDDDTDA